MLMHRETQYLDCIRSLNKENWRAEAGFYPLNVLQLLLWFNGVLCFSFIHTAVVWMFVCSPKDLCWNPNVQGVGIRKWGLQEVLGSRGWSSQDGISVLIRETPQSSLVPSALWGHNERSVTRERALLQTMQPSWSQTSRLQNHEKQISVVCKPPSLWYFLIAAHMDWDACPTEIICSHPATSPWSHPPSRQGLWCTHFCILCPQQGLHVHAPHTERAPLRSVANTIHHGLPPMLTPFPVFSLS